MLPLRAIVDLEAMATKKYSTFRSDPLLEPKHQIVGGVFPSAEMEMEYSATPVDEAIVHLFKIWRKRFCFYHMSVLDMCHERYYL